MGVKFGMEEGTFGPLLHAKFHSHRCNVSPLRGEKPQNRPLSKLNTGRFALRAMLPVISEGILDHWKHAIVISVKVNMAAADILKFRKSRMSGEVYDVK